MPDLERAYRSLPVAAQHAVVSLEGRRVVRQRINNPESRRLLQAAEARDTWSTARIEELRDERLRRMVSHAYDHVPYYRHLFDEHGIPPDSILCLADLRQLPVLSKATIQDAGVAIHDDRKDRPPSLVAHPSGTTGGGLRFPVTHSAMREQWAVWWRYRRRHDLALGTWCGYFGGRSVVPVERRRAPYWRYDFGGRRVLFSAYHLNEETAIAYASEIRRRRLPWLHGYPSMLALFASFLSAAGQTLEGVVRWTTCGAESLLPHQRAVIADVFGVDPLEHYGMAEGVANASQCLNGKLHIDEDFAAVELVPNDQLGAYSIIGTTLANTAAPLIRYDTQDVVGGISTCNCGLPGRVIEAIDGRQEDYVVLPDGSRLGRLDHIFKDLVAVREAQIRQDEVGIVDFLIVKGPTYSASDEAALLSEARRRLGRDTNVRIHYVDQIPRTSSGKLRFVVTSVTS